MTPIRRLALVFIVLLGGCSHFDYTSVHVNIGAIKLADAGANGTDAVFTLNIMNETMFPIVIEEERHKITLNGTYVGEGTNKDSYGLPNLKVTTRQVTVHLSDAAAVERVRDAIKNGGTYSIETRLITNAAGDHDKVTTTSTGRLLLGAN